MEQIFKVSSHSRTASVAGAIANVVRREKGAILQAIGAGSVNQANKAVTLARAYLAADGIEVVCIPTFVDDDIEGQERTALRLFVQIAGEPLPPAIPLPPKTE